MQQYHGLWSCRETPKHAGENLREWQARRGGPALEAIVGAQRARGP